MSEALTVQRSSDMQAETMEKVLVGGNLAVLTPAERMTYYKAVCESVGLNPLTRPFEYLTLNGKLILYARREATEQLRKIHGVSIGKLEKTFHGDDLYIVEAPASDKSGRTDSSTGAVSIKGLAGEAKANAIMKCETKAKRRVTLSICGLGLPDETEVDSIPGAVRVQLPEAGDDVPAVDVNEDKPKMTARQINFVKACRELKARMPGATYYGILGGAGYEHSNEVPDDKETMEPIYRKLEAAANDSKTKTQVLKEKVKQQVAEVAAAEKLFAQ